MPRRGIIGTIVDFAVAIFVLGIIVAILMHFNWDVGSAISWVFTSIENMVLGVAHWFSHLPFFNKLFG